MRTGVLAIAFALALTAPASAATLSVKDTSIVFQAASGETNKPSITSFNGTISATDSSATVVAGPGCAPDGPDKITCPAHLITSVVVRLSDGNDQLQSSPSQGAVLPAGVKLSVEGGLGNDTIFGTKADDTILGGPGADLLYGQGGRDKMVGSSGKDRLQGQGRLYGNSGNDYIVMFLSGNPRVRSKAYGGPGNDNILGGNKVRDIVDCGLGRNDTFTTTDRRGVDRYSRCENHIP